MTGKRYSLDINDNSLINRIFKIVLGILCIFASVYFIINMAGTEASTTTSWIAMIFIVLFGIWEILSGSRVTDKYIIIEEKRITIRQNPLALPVILASTDIESIEFGPLTLSFGLKAGEKIKLRMGTYNRERSESIMEEVEKFCQRNIVSTKGLESTDQTDIS